MLRNVLLGIVLLAGLADVTALDALVLPRYLRYRGEHIAAVRPEPAGIAVSPGIVRRAASSPEASTGTLPSIIARGEPTPVVDAGVDFKSQADVNSEPTSPSLAARSPIDSPLPSVKPFIFANGSARLNQENVESLASIAEILASHPALQIELHGHADITGEDDINLTLSKLRAQTIAKALIDLGVSRARIVTAGFGSKFPLDRRTAPEAWARNRRVELIWAPKKEKK